MRRTFRTRAGIGGSEKRMETRLYLRATAVGALHQQNPTGTKILKRFFKAKMERKPTSLGELHKWRRTLQ